MKFSCDVSLLRDAVANVSLAVSQKSTIPALEGILIECRDSVLTLTGYDLDLGIVKQVPVKMAEEGTIVLKARLFGEILRKLPSDMLLFISDDRLITTITSGDAEFNIMGMDAGEFPDMPHIEDDSAFNISEALLKNMISQTLFAVAMTDQTPVHTGSLFDIDNGMLNLVSVDGYRLAVRKEPIDAKQDHKFVVPGKTLSELSKLLSEDEEKIARLLVSKKHIVIEIDGYRVVSRLLEGEFLDYKNSIPDGAATTVNIDTKTFISSIERVSIIIDDRIKSPVRCVISDSQVSLTCESGIGKVSDRFAADITGEDVTVGFNNRYMIDALKNSGCDEVLLQVNSPLYPMKIVPSSGESFLFLVLPIRLKA